MSTNLETLEGAWTANPGGLLFAQYAEALHREGRTRDAQSILADGLARWPKHFSARLLKGRLAMDLGDLEAARTAFQEAVDQDNNSPAALRSLAVVLGKQQYQRQAIDLWVRLSLLDPDNPDAAATARRMIADLETTSSLADLGLGIRDTEDAASREALSEGASSGIAPKGLSGIDADSPLAGWNSDAPLAGDPAFDLGDLAFPTPPSLNAPSVGQSTTNWTPGAGLDSGHHQTISDPVTEMEVAKPLLGPSEDSGFATLEMAAFPEKSIPPPPLELPKPRLAAGNDSDTRIMSPVAPLPLPSAIVAEPAPEVTQFMPRPSAPSAPVTGDDIGARLDALFSEPEPEVSALQAIAPLLAPQVAAPPIPPAPVSRPGSVVDTPTRVSGDDVEDRLSELLGSPSETAELLAPVLEPPPAPTRSSAVSKAAVTGNDIEARLDDLFGASEVDLPVMEAPEVPAPPSAPSSLPPAASPSAAVSGRDIEDRLDSLFGNESEVRTDTLKASETSAMDRDSLLGDAPSEGAEATLESMRAFETAAAPMLHGLSKRPDETVTLDNFSNPSSTDAAAERLVANLDPSDVDSGGSTLDLPTVGALPVVAPPTGASGKLTGGQDLDSQLDELFASSEFLLDDASPPPQKSPSPAGGPVTGDDIGDRLDDLFGSDSDFPAGVPTVTLAEEYLRQGYRDQALAVYRQLASRDPANTELSRRIAEIEAAGT